MAYKIKPSSGRIAVKVEDGQTIQEKHGIFLVRLAESTPTTGTVVAVCDDYEFDGEPYEPIYKVGDLVVFGKYTGSEVRVDRDRVIILREADVLCRIVSEDNEARQISIRGRAETN